MKQQKQQQGIGKVISSNVLALAAKEGVSIRELERTVGLSNGTIGKWATMGERGPAVGSVLAIARHYDLSLDELLSST